MLEVVDGCRDEQRVGLPSGDDFLKEINKSLLKDRGLNDEQAETLVKTIMDLLAQNIIN